MTPLPNQFVNILLSKKALGDRESFTSITRFDNTQKLRRYAERMNLLLR